VVIAALGPIQKKYLDIRADSVYLQQILDKEADFTRSISSQKIKKVIAAMGLGR
jgi:hypothetical protein